MIHQHVAIEIVEFLKIHVTVRIQILIVEINVANQNQIVVDLKIHVVSQSLIIFLINFKSLAVIRSLIAFANVKKRVENVYQIIFANNKIIVAIQIMIVVVNITMNALIQSLNVVVNIKMYTVIQSLNVKSHVKNMNQNLLVNEKNYVKNVNQNLFVSVRNNAKNMNQKIVVNVKLFPYQSQNVKDQRKMLV